MAAALICCGAFAVATASAGQNRGPGGGGNSGRGGGDIDDQHLFEIEISMTPTADAPAGSSVRFKLEVEDEDGGARQTEMEIEPRGLPAGSYSVNAIRKSDGGSVLLTAFTVGSGQDDVEVELGHDGTEFPGVINPLDIGSVNLTAVNGVVLFTIDLSNITTANSMNINVNKAAVAGAGVPNASGNVILNAFLSRGRVKGSLIFTGQGLPANMPVFVAVNGVRVKAVRINRNGNFNFKLGPKGKTGQILPGVTLAGITTVALLDRNGNVLLQVSL
ncbi:MAG TPA: hypothetical protein VJ719_04835 [Chthoniobacterales bacterium]|nr:hypothetical protein [Chthoniobacterales bacterium]